MEDVWWAGVNARLSAKIRVFAKPNYYKIGGAWAAGAKTPAAPIRLFTASPSDK